MKFLAIFIVLFGLAGNATEAPATTTPKMYDLMKCFSAKNGTVWASFGHVILSNESVPRYFPTEIILFGEVNTRWVWKTLDEALKMDMYAHPGFVRLQFTAMRRGIKQTHLLRAMRYDKDLPAAFVGNWSVSEEDKIVSSDQVYCTVL